MKIRFPHHFPPNKLPMITTMNVLQTILCRSKKKQIANPEQGHTQGE